MSQTVNICATNKEIADQLRKIADSVENDPQEQSCCMVQHIHTIDEGFGNRRYLGNRTFVLNLGPKNFFYPMPEERVIAIERLLGVTRQ